jgi:hypothetical protein
MEIYTRSSKDSRDKQVGELVSYLPKISYLSKSAPPKGKGEGMKLISVVEPQLRSKIAKEDAGLFNTKEERVHGLSGNNLEYEEKSLRKDKAARLIQTKIRVCPGIL